MHGRAFRGLPALLTGPSWGTGFGVIYVAVIWYVTMSEADIFYVVSNPDYPSNEKSTTVVPQNSKKKHNSPKLAPTYNDGSLGAGVLWSCSSGCRPVRYVGAHLLVYSFTCQYVVYVVALFRSNFDAIACVHADFTLSANLIAGIPCSANSECPAMEYCTIFSSSCDVRGAAFKCSYENTYCRIAKIYCMHHTRTHPFRSSLVVLNMMHNRALKLQTSCFLAHE